MEIYGYCRCSTNESKQDINRQVKELEKLGISAINIYKEYESGKKDDRIEWLKLKGKLVDGDTIATTEVSRLTRSTKQLCEIIEFAKKKHLKLIIGNFIVDCTKDLDPMTKGMLQMMGVFAEMEASMISQRVKSGMAHAKNKGAKLGRPLTKIADIPSKFLKNYELYVNNNINITQLAKMSDLSRQSCYKYIEIIKLNVK